MASPPACNRSSCQVPLVFTPKTGYGSEHVTGIAMDQVYAQQG